MTMTSRDDDISGVCSSLLPIIDASIVPAILVDAESGVIVRCNSVAAQLFGWEDIGSVGPFTEYVSFYEDDKKDDEEPLSWEDVTSGLGAGRVKLNGVGMTSSDKGFPVAAHLTKLGSNCRCSNCGSGNHQQQADGGNTEYIFAYVQQKGMIRRASGRRLLEEAKKDIKRNQRLTAGIIDASFDPMFAINERGIIQMVNEAAVEQFGWSEDELVDSNISMIVGGGHAERHDKYIERYLQTGEKRVMGLRRELPARRKDGTEFPIELGLTEVKVEEGEDRLFTGFLHDLTDIKRKQRLTAGIIDASFDPMFAINERGIISMVNEAAIKQFGWSENELVGSNISMIVGGGHAERHDQYIERYLQTGEKRVMGLRRELPARRKDGTEFPIELGLTEVKVEEGEDRLFTGFLHDLTDIKRKQRLTAGIIDASFDPMFAINERGIISMVNEAAIKQFGWSENELVGSNISMIVGGGHAERHDQYIERYLQTGEKRVMGLRRELPARRKDGTEFPIELGLTEVKVEEGEDRLFTGFLHDLTDIKRKQRLTAGIIDASFDPMFAINERGIISMVNEAAIKQFGWSEDELVDSNISMIVGGGHAERHDQYIQRYLKTGQKRVMGLRRELPARRKDGTEFPIELGLTEVKVEDGEDRLFTGFLRDLTDIKRKQRLTAGIINASFDPMFAISEKGIITMVNEAAIKQFGWKRDDFIGSNISMIVGGGHAKNHDQYIQRYLKTGEKRVMGVRRELLARRADGTEFTIELGLTEVKVEEGEERLFTGFVRDITLQKKLLEVELESAKAEALLLNMLPEDVALRLKKDPGHIADHYSNVAILFADIVGFTNMSSNMSPVEVVQMLNELFSMFDVLVEKYDLNKVKTIGDCYMVTSHPGVESEVDECLHMCRFGLEMIDALHDYNRRNSNKTMNLRVGINVGPVVAGVVGTKRFLFDLWGDAVNLASRMESTGIPGKIQCTKEVREKAGESFIFESRGTVRVKGKGDMETYILVGTRDDRPLPSVPSRRAVMERKSVNLFESLRKMKSTRELLDNRIGDVETQLEDVAEER